MDEPTINKPVDRFDNCSAVNNRYNHNLSANDCSFMMHEANIQNMDTRRELVQKPDKVESPVPFASSVINNGLIKQKKTVLREQNVVADKALPNQRWAMNEPADRFSDMVPSFPKTSSTDILKWNFFLEETIAFDVKE